VISADTALALNDFRSEERTFQLVLQVAGRSGRGDAPGHVVVQTFAKDTAAIKHAVKGDYEAFADAELLNRKSNHLPPCTRMMRIVLADAKASKVQAAARDMAEKIRDLLQKRGIRADIHGPQPAAIPRIRDQYRYDLLLTFTAAAALLSAVDCLKSEGALRAGVKSMTIDIDPVSLQ
jgi:primosomal protein N' (replication factor Y)